jgi:hypothetical protein
VLELAMLEPVRDRQALVRIVAANSELDGLVLRGVLDARGAFVTRIHGADWTLLRLTEGRGSVTAPGAEFTVTFAASEPASPGDDLRAAHERQLASGALALLAKKPFPFLVRKYEAKAATTLAGLNAACGTHASFAFDWATFADDDMAELDVWALCEPLLAVAQSRCKAVAGIVTLTCRRGATFDLARGADQLTFTTTEKGKAEGRAWLTSALGKP